MKLGKEFAQNEHYTLSHIAVQCLIELNASKECLAALEQSPLQHYALLALQQMHTKDTVDGLITVATNTNDDALRVGALGALSRLMHLEKPWDLKAWWSTRPDDRGPYFEPIPWEASERIKAALEANFAKVSENDRNPLIELFAKNRLDVSQLNLLNKDPVATALGQAQPDEPSTAILVNAAKDTKLPWPRRIECYNAALRSSNDKTTGYRLEILAAWLDEANRDPSADQLITDFVNETNRGTEVAKLDELAKKSGDTAARIAWRALLTVLNSPLSKEESKKQVRDIADKNPMEVGFFLALADLKTPGFEKQIEAGMHFDNEKTIKVASAAMEAITTASASPDGKKMADLKADEVKKIAMESKGDIANGAKHFTALGCIACHSIDPAAAQKGPYLGAAGAKFQRDYLIESVLDPGKVVAQGFQTSVFAMKDHSTKMGFVTAEQDGVITLRDITGAASQIKRADVKEEQHPGTSMMPAGLASGLTSNQFTDLIEYLSSLKQAGG